MAARVVSRHVPYFTKSYPRPWYSTPALPGDAAIPPKGRTTMLCQTYQKPEVEIYVDASGWGLGMTVGDEWQAWRWRPNSSLIRRHPQTNEIYAHWAELEAVELGIWALIQEGLRHARVLVNTDNQAVFETFRKILGIGHPTLWNIGACKSGLLGEGVGRIGELLEKYGLELGIQWVAGKTNPADRPSRGKGLLQGSRFSGGFHLPRHLAGMVSIA